ncbi:MAG TPA: methyltransferase domain-containing protein, partial [Thermoanaerobaculia bacterium]
MRLRDLGELWRLSVRRTESEQSYREFQGFQARLLIRYMEDHGVRFAGSSLLDLGSGLGGYSRELAARGARVVAVDLTQPRIRDAAIRRVRASGDAVPLRDGAV